MTAPASRGLTVGMILKTEPFPKPEAAQMTRIVAKKPSKDSGAEEPRQAEAADRHDADRDRRHPPRAEAVRGPPAGGAHERRDEGARERRVEERVRGAARGVGEDRLDDEGSEAPIATKQPKVRK